MKELIIYTMDYKNPYTGGLRFTNSFADYAKNNYSKTTIIDFAQLPRIARRFHLITIIYFTNFLFRRNNCYIVADHAFHLRLLPLIFFRRFKKLNYMVLFFQRFYHLQNNPFIKFLKYLSEKFFLKKAHLIIVPSQSAKKEVIKFGIREAIIQVVNPTVSIMGDGFGKSSFQGNLLFVGQVKPWKGLDILIRALTLIKDMKFCSPPIAPGANHINFKELTAKFRIHLDVVGRYDSHDKYFKSIWKLIKQNGLEPNIQFHGQKTGTGLKELFQKADIFIFPSRSETFGIVLLEAMSFGLPIIASAIPSTLEIIENNKNGILFSANNSKELAEALRILLTNAELRKKISTTNLKRSKSILSEEEVAAQVFNLVRPCLEANL